MRLEKAGSLGPAFFLRFIEWNKSSSTPFKPMINETLSNCNFIKKSYPWLKELRFFRLLYWHFQ